MARDAAQRLADDGRFSVMDHGEDDRPRYLFYDPVTDERREGLTEEEALILLDRN